MKLFGRLLQLIECYFISYADGSPFLYMTKLLSSLYLLECVEIGGISTSLWSEIDLRLDSTAYWDSTCGRSLGSFHLDDQRPTSACG